MVGIVGDEFAVECVDRSRRAVAPFEFECAGEKLQALPAGALHWPARRLLAVADSLKARVMLSLGYGCGLRAGEVDVLTLSPTARLPDEGIDQFTELGMEHNAGIRVLVQASWVGFDSPTANPRTFKNAQRDVANVWSVGSAVQLRGEIY